MTNKIYTYLLSRESHLDIIKAHLLHYLGYLQEKYTQTYRRQWEFLDFW